MSSISRRIWVIRCRWPTGSGGSPGSVTSMRSSARRRSSSAALELVGALARAAPRAPAAPRWPPCPTGPRSSGGSSPIERSTLVSSALRPEVAHPQLLELGRLGRRARSRPRPRCRSSGRGRGLRHGAAILFASSYSADRGRHGHVERVGAVVAQRDARAASRALEQLGGSPSRSAPRQTTTRRARRDLGERRSAVRGRARAACPGSRRAPARAGGRANSEPMLARTAFGENGSAQPGPEDHGAVAERVRRADDRADVAGVVHAVQVDATASPPGSDQRCAVDADHARAGAERAAPRRAASGSTSSPGAQQISGSQPAAAAASTRSSPSATNRPSRSRQLPVAGACGSS